MQYDMTREAGKSAKKASTSTLRLQRMEFSNSQNDLPIDPILESSNKSLSGQHLDFDFVKCHAEKPAEPI